MQNRKIMHLHAPRIERNSGLSRLVASFELDGETRGLFFEVEDEFGPYLTAERSDAFVLIVLIWALYDGFDISYEAPITDRLHYQLSEYFIPIVCKYIEQYHYIKLEGPVAPEIEPIEHGVVTGLSCGVDSFYTVLSHSDPSFQGQKITHLIMNNVGALTKSYDNSVKVFNKRKRKFQEVANEQNCTFVAVNTNIVQYLEGYPDYVNSPETFKNAACAYALKQMFSCYYYSPAYDASVFMFNWEDPCYYEPIVMNSISLSFLPFYSARPYVSRGEKIEYIADVPVVQRNLNVCGDSNCGVCFKCTRTMFELYSIGRLDDFAAVFDVDFFKDNLADRIASTYFDPNERKDKIAQETMRIARENGVRIPLATYFYGLFKYVPLYFLRDRLRAIKPLRDFYRKHHFREKLFNKKRPQWK